MSNSLSVVAANDLGGVKQESVAKRVRRLQDEARRLARDHIYSFTSAMLATKDMALEIAEGGEVYPAGVRDMARRYAEDCDARAANFETITARVD